jgi:N-acetyl-anhydromuramyl-L-alanine amidase AmpD
MQLIESPTVRVLPARQAQIQAIIVHTTGESDAQGVLRFYRSPDGLQPHYVVMLDGTVHRIVTEDRVAYHAKIDPAEAALYRQGWNVWRKWWWKQGAPVDMREEFSGYRSWRETWIEQATPPIESPLDLVTGPHPNARSVGIELLQPKTPGPDIFTDAQYAALIELVAEIGARHKLPLDRRHVLGHYDVSPMRRSSARGGWDPGERFAWGRLLGGLRTGTATGVG